MDIKEFFKNRKILTDGKNNMKLAKNNIRTYYLSLQPVAQNSKGLNLCKFSTEGCRNACLQYTGQQIFSNVKESRSRKTEYFVQYPKEFVEHLWNELIWLNGKDTKIAVRLNLLSDVNWEDYFKKYLDEDCDFNQLTNIIGYDYTKDPFKIPMNNWKNYNLTFSFSGGNWLYCEEFLKKKLANVAVVFKNGLPLQWKGFPVVDGDISDERFLEEKGVIVGLHYKQTKGVPYKPSKFIIDEINST